MSLRGRLLLVLILLNVGVLAVLQAASWSLQRRWLDDYQEVYQGVFQDVLRHAYAPGPVAGAQRVRRILSTDLRSMFRDVLITNGAVATQPGHVHLNPLGSARRDPLHFDLRGVLAGIETAIRDRRVVPSEGGFCVPIVAGSEVAGGAWYTPFVPALPALPYWMFAVPVAVSVLLFGVLAFWSIGRAMARPMLLVGSAAQRVGQGEHGVRVPRLAGATELDPLVDTFNVMAEKVERHTEELAREVRRATEEARRKEQAMVVSGRLAAMGTLAAGIAHEINNPLGGMLNAVHRLQQSPGLTEREKSYLELVQEGLERVRGTTRKVLDFSPRQIQAMPFQLAEAVQGARSLVEHRLAVAGVALQVELPAGLPALFGDRHEIQQVLLNVFLNSLDVLEGQPEPRTIRLRAAAAQGFLEVWIEDNGPGCTKETLARVLDPFFSDKGRPDATGLGLVISYSIVRNHGGDLTVDSAPGRGFCVHLRLPVQGPA